MSAKPHTEESLAHARLIASLPMRARLALYIKGLWIAYVKRGWRAIPILAVFPLGMLACAGRAAWLVLGDPQVKVHALPLAAAAVMLGVGLALFTTFKVMVEENGLEMGMDECLWRKWCSLAIAAACLCALSSPWMRPDPLPSSERGMRQAYQADVADMSQAGLSGERIQQIWAQGRISRVFANCNACDELNMSAAPAGRMTPPSFKEVMERAAAFNGQVVGVKAIMAMLAACVADALGLGIFFLVLGALAGLLDLARLMAAACLRGGLGRAARACARSPASFLAWMAGCFDQAKREAAAAVLVDPLARAEYERRALEDGAAKGAKAAQAARL